MSLVYSRKSVGPRMDPWGTPALIGYSSEDFPSRTTLRHLLLRKDEIRPNIWPDIPQVCEEDLLAEPCWKPWIYQVLQLEQPQLYQVQLSEDLQKNFMAPSYRWDSTASRLKKHNEETVYFVPFSSQEFLVHNWSTSEGWKAELTLEQPSGFEPGTLGLGIQHLNQ